MPGNFRLPPTAATYAATPAATHDDNNQEGRTGFNFSFGCGVGTGECLACGLQGCARRRSSRSATPQDVSCLRYRESLALHLDLQGSAAAIIIIAGIGDLNTLLVLNRIKLGLDRAVQCGRFL